MVAKNEPISNGTLSQVHESTKEILRIIGDNESGLAKSLTLTITQLNKKTGFEMVKRGLIKV